MENVHLGIIDGLKELWDAEAYELPYGLPERFNADAGPGSRGMANPHVVVKDGMLIIYKNGVEAEFELADPGSFEAATEFVGATRRFTYEVDHGFRPPLADAPLLFPSDRP